MMLIRKSHCINIDNSGFARTIIMSNISSFNNGVSGKENISLTSQGTDCFLELLIIAADTFEKTEN